MILFRIFAAILCVIINLKHRSMEKKLDYFTLWRGCLLAVLGIVLPLSAMADEVTVADVNGNELSDR